MIEFLVFLVIGGIAGVLAGKIMEAEQNGILRNVLLGIAGAVVGGFLFSLLGIKAVGLIGSVVTATCGAVVVIFVARKIQTKRQIKR
jgi:uncharacterized membrane protein YeaQ/YmgE (transglycosylase-associated protein family)